MKGVPLNEKDRIRTEHGGRRPAAHTQNGEPSQQSRGMTETGRPAKDLHKGNGERDSQGRRGGSTALTPREQRALRSRIKDKEWSEGITRTKGGPDAVFLVLLIIIISIGVIMVYSASYPMAIQEGKSGFHYVGKQLLCVVLGAFAMTFTMFFPYRYYRKMSLLIYGFGAVLLLLVLFVGEEGGGAQRWLKLTDSFGIQPSEIAKFCLPVVLAAYCEKYGDRFERSLDRRTRFIYGVLIPSIFIFVYAILIALEKHLSGLFIVSLIGVIVLLLNGAPFLMSFAYYAVTGGLGILAFLVVNPYALKRIQTFFDANADNLNENWQTYQGSLAIGSGGFLGIGLGQSRQKNSYVSEAQNDFIFTIWCEEMGFVGAVLVIALFLALIYRGYRIALKAPDTFSSLLVFGIMTQVGIQVILNLMVVTDNFMNTGISLPFLSSGGTSLVVLMAEMGVVLAVSRRSYEKKG